MKSNLLLAALVGLASSAQAQSLATITAITTAHASLASLAFIFFFPIAAIIIAIGGFSSAIRVHAALQILAYTMFIAAAGCGIWLALTEYELDETHPKIGLFLLAILFFQAPTGWLHHYLFKKNHKASVSTWWHRIIGRCAILLGMINGGLGLQLAQEETKWITAYSVVAGIIGAAYIGAIIYSEIIRSRRSTTQAPSRSSVETTEAKA